MHSLSRPLLLLLPLIPIITAGLVPSNFQTTALATSLNSDIANLAEPDHPININTTLIRLASPTNLSDHTITFVDVIYDGVHLTKSRYRHAVFREAQATSTVGPTTNPHFLTDMRLIFSITEEGDYRSVYIDMSKNWPQWGQPRLTTSSTPEGNGVLPSRFGMDIVAADRHMKAAGFGERYDHVNVRWPADFPEERQQALYYFQMERGEQLDFVAVGARNGEVTAIYRRGSG